MLDQDLVRKFLACPACKSPVREVRETLLCVNAECRRQYPVRDGIPVMIIEEARTVDISDYKKLTTKE